MKASTLKRQRAIIINILEIQEAAVFIAKRAVPTGFRLDGSSAYRCDKLQRDLLELEDAACRALNLVKACRAIVETERG